MALKEYEPGTAFPGVIGRTVESHSPHGPSRSRQGGRSERPLHRPRRHGLRSARLLRHPIETPNIDGWPATACATPTCTRRRCARRAARASSPAATTTPTRWRASPRARRATPAPTASSRSRTGSCRRSCSQHGYNTFAVGKWHLTPPSRVRGAGPYDRWPLGRGFERYYGFLGGDTHQYYPDLVHDNHQVAPPKTPEEGYHLTEDLVDKAIGIIADAKQVAPDKPFFMYFCTGRDARARITCPRSGRTSTRAQFDDGWDAYREKVFERQKKLGLSRRTPSCRAATPTCQPWDTCSRRREAALRADDGGVRRLPRAHRPSLSAGCSTSSKAVGELDNTLVMFISDNGASAEGGPHGSVNENLFFNNVPETLEDNLKALDELGGPKYFNHYPWGWAWAGNTPFRRWKRETYRGGVDRSVHRALAQGHQGQGRGPHAVRARHRHGPDRARRARHRAAGADPRRDPVADRGRQLRAHVRRRAGADRATSRSTSR